MVRRPKIREIPGYFFTLQRYRQQSAPWHVRLRYNKIRGSVNEGMRVELDDKVLWLYAFFTGKLVDPLDSPEDPPNKENIRVLGPQMLHKRQYMTAYVTRDPVKVGDVDAYLLKWVGCF